MSNSIGVCAVLQDPSGIFSDAPAAKVHGICLKSALTGNLTIVGITQNNGNAQGWIITGGTSGYVATPGSGHSGGGALSFTYANPGADAGKAIVMLATAP